jgi:hypothetical protein
MLKKAVYEKMKDFEDDKENIIYENYQEEDEIRPYDTYKVIVKTSTNNFRIYSGMLHSTGNVTVKFIFIDDDMIKAFEILQQDKLINPEQEEKQIEKGLQAFAKYFRALWW